MNQHEDVVELTSDDTFVEAFPVMRELRGHLDERE